MFQGDARYLTQVLEAGGVITSPPFTPKGTQIKNMDYASLTSKDDTKNHDMESPGNIANMPVGVLTSPPYMEGLGHSKTPTQRDIAKNTMSALSISLTIALLGGLKDAITSPPYADLHVSNEKQYQENNTHQNDGYAENSRGQIRGAITSPPFSPDGNQPVIGQGTRAELKVVGREPDNKEQSTVGNIALYKTPPLITVSNIDPDSYWGAITMVLNNLWDILPPDGVVAWVVKAFVKNKKIVDLPSMSLDLFESLGWVPEMWIDASLTRESGKPYKSFFRRLWENKPGYPSIDEEVILIMRRS